MEKSDGARKQKLITGILESYCKDKSAKAFPHVPEAFIKSKFDTAFQEKLFKLSSKELQELSDCLKKESEAKEAYSKLEKAFGKKNPKSEKAGGQQNIKTIQELYTVYQGYLKDVQLKLINPQFNRVKQKNENELAQLTNHREKFQKLSAQDQTALQPLLEQATTLWKEVITASRPLMDNALPIFYDAIHSIEEEELKRSDKSAGKKEPGVDGKNPNSSGGKTDSKGGSGEPEKSSDTSDKGGSEEGSGVAEESSSASGGKGPEGKVEGPRKGASTSVGEGSERKSGEAGKGSDQSDKGGSEEGRPGAFSEENQDNNNANYAENVKNPETISASSSPVIEVASSKNNDNDNSTTNQNDTDQSPDSVVKEKEEIKNSLQNLLAYNKKQYKNVIKAISTFVNGIDIEQLKSIESVLQDPKSDQNTKRNKLLTELNNIKNVSNVDNALSTIKTRINNQLKETNTSKKKQ
ncbi:hypothetical protein [Cardinium endosymbiont of Nabis limbatus]|uniref:hypothetical protein n=1 Tax=Cardinium endosymbiont of Nabis limbatus TaxID=3066217 RepID=UPI003AF380CC